MNFKDSALRNKWSEGSFDSDSILGANHLSTNRQFFVGILGKSDVYIVKTPHF
jgi:hypothetical protein